MKRIIFFIVFFSPFIMKAQKNDIVKQLIDNLHGGVEINRVNGRQSYSVYAGTGYKYFFYKNSAYFYPQLDLKWGQYRYSSNSDHYTETASFTIPLIVGYQVYGQNSMGIHVFGGGRYEQIVYTIYNSHPSKVNTTQVGLTAGATVRISSRFGFSVSYYHSLTSLFKEDSDAKPTSFNFSFLF